MQKVKTLAIVSLSAGTIGENFVKHELDLGLKRLAEMGMEVKFMPHALNGIAYVREHPEDRAADLIAAFEDPSVDMIFCAIGGEDTYRIAPYLFENDALKKVLCQKIFLGFSDSTMNHLMLHKLGLSTFYGQSFLADTCDIAPEIFAYTRHYFEELLETGTVSEIRPSDVWYSARTDFSVEAMGTLPEAHVNEGFELLQGAPRFTGPILGGCIDTIYGCFDTHRFADSPEVAERYGLFPSREDWAGRIMLLETSEEMMPPETYRDALLKIKTTGAFDVISGLLIGKPVNEQYADEYKAILKEVLDNQKLPVVCNINIGHATPRCIIPFGIEAQVDADEQVIRFAR